MPKYNVQDRIDAFAAKAEDSVATDMFNDFKQPLLQQFKKRKGAIEDWQDVENQLPNLKNRLRVIADKQAWTMDNIMDMALICAIIWNDRTNGN
jgi:hypothetical protein